MGEYKRNDLRAATLCVENHIVIVAHSGVGKSGGLHKSRAVWCMQRALVYSMYGLLHPKC